MGMRKKYGGKGQIIVGKYYAVQGNILVDQRTVEAMAKTLEETKGNLDDRLVAELVAGGKAGGDKRGELSAALLVVKKGAGYDSTMDNTLTSAFMITRSRWRNFKDFINFTNFTFSKAIERWPRDESIVVSLKNKTR